MLFGILVYFVTHKSKEITALLGGIAAPGLIFALSTGNNLGEKGSIHSDLRHVIDMSIISSAKAGCDCGEFGSDIGVFGISNYSDTRLEKMPICSIPQTENGGFRVENPSLPEGFRNLSVSLIARDRDSLLWASVADLRLIMHTKLENELYSCVAPNAGTSASFYGKGFLFAVELLGGKNHVSFSTERDNVVRLHGRFEANVNFAEGLWWRLGGSVSPQIAVSGEKFMNDGEVSDWINQKLRDGTF